MGSLQFARWKYPSSIHLVPMKAPCSTPATCSRWSAAAHRRNPRKTQWPRSLAEGNGFHRTPWEGLASGGGIQPTEDSPDKPENDGVVDGCFLFLGVNSQIPMFSFQGVVGVFKIKSWSLFGMDFCSETCPYVASPFTWVRDFFHQKYNFKTWFPREYHRYLCRFLCFTSMDHIKNAKRSRSWLQIKDIQICKTETIYPAFLCAKQCHIYMFFSAPKQIN